MASDVSPGEAIRANYIVLRDALERYRIAADAGMISIGHTIVTGADVRRIEAQLDAALAEILKGDRKEAGHEGYPADQT